MFRNNKSEVTMERTQPELTEGFISNWNEAIPNSPLTIADLKNPHSLMRALFQVFDRLGIDHDAVLATPPKEERKENSLYYWDLFPVINMTRVINHLVTVMPQLLAKITITHLLQPTFATSRCLLFLLFNWMLFNEQRFSDIAPHEEKLFVKADEVKALEDVKNRLIQKLNEQAEEKANHAARLEKIDHEIKDCDEELKKTKVIQDEKRQELEVISNMTQQTKLLLEQKKTHRDALLADVVRTRALRVYDVEDITAQAEQATQTLKELEETLDSLQAKLMQKENSLKNLQTIKPNLVSADNLLHEIMKQANSLKDSESGDLDADSKEGEQDVINTELGELAAQLSELQAAREDAARKRSDSQAKRQQQRTVAHSALREAEEREKKLRERSKEDSRRTEVIKKLTDEYDAKKIDGFEQLTLIESEFISKLKTIDETLLNKIREAAKSLKKKVNERHNRLD